MIIFAACAVPAVFALSFWFFIFRPLDGLFSVPKSPASTESADKTAKQYFLQELDFDAGPVTLVFHEAATGKGEAILTDHQLIRRNQDVAYFTDDPGAQTRLTLLSIIFLSPSGTGTSDAFVSVYQNGDLLQRHTCFKLYCKAANPDFDRDVKDLLAGAVMATDHSFRTMDFEAFNAKLDQIDADPALVYIHERPDNSKPHPFPGHFRINFPSYADVVRDEGDEPSQEALDRIEGYKVWIEDALSRHNGAYSLGTIEMERQTRTASFQAQGDAPRMVDEETGIPVYFDRIDLYTYAVHVKGDAALHAYLEAEAERAPPVPSKVTDALNQAFDDTVLRVTGKYCEECYILNVYGFSPKTRVGWFEEDPYYVFWYAPEITTSDPPSTD